MNFPAQPNKYSCPVHGENLNVCSQVNPDDVLKRLRRAKETCLDPQLILLDVRESVKYQEGHILTACAMNCSTKTMAKRAIVTWDTLYANQQMCPAPYNPEQPYFCTKITNVLGPSLVIYDQHGDCPLCSPNLAVLHLITSLVTRGNYVFFMNGGFDAFSRLPCSDFIDCGTPIEKVDLRKQHMNGFVPVHNNGLLISSLPMVKDSHTMAMAPQFTKLEHRNSASGLRRSRPGRGSRSTSRLEKHQVIYPNLASHYSEIQALRIPTNHAVPKNIIPPAQPNDPDNVLDAPVSEILPFLFIGNARDARDEALLRRLNVTHVLNVTETASKPPVANQRLHHLHLPAVDNERQDLRPLFFRAVKFIDDARRANGIVLVHCLAGVSRSVTLVIAFLLHSGYYRTVLSALEFIQSCRPVAGPSLNFMGQLQDFCNEVNAVMPNRSRNSSSSSSSSSCSSSGDQN